MALYELNDAHVKNVMAVLSDANIKGHQAYAIAELQQLFTNPVKKKEDEVDK